MPRETERAIASARQIVECGWWFGSPVTRSDLRALLAEHDRLKKELARLTELQYASKHDRTCEVICWALYDGVWLCEGVDSIVAEGLMWTHLQTPVLPKEASHEPQD